MATNEYIDSTGLETLWGQIRAADALNVSKAGDIMTGALEAPQITIIDSDGWPNLLFHTTSSDTYNGAVQFNGATGNHFALIQKDLNNPDYYESFGLPDPDSDLTASKWYSILTTKNAVTIEQGGTGQTTRAAATNTLFSLGANPVTSTTNDTTTNWKNLRAGIAWYNTNNYLNGQPSQYGLLLNLNTSASNSDVHQIWAAQSNGSLFHRGGNASGWGSDTWKTILDSGNYTSFVTPANIGAATSSHTHSYLPLSGGTLTGGLTGTYITSKNYYQTHTDGGAYVINSRASDGSSHRAKINIGSNNAWAFIHHVTTGGSVTETFNFPAPSVTANATYTILTTKNTVTVGQGGTGATTLTSGAALIGNGTGAIQTRAILNNTSKTYVGTGTDLITKNTLAYWNGSYGTSNASNISYVGTISGGVWQGSAIAAAYIGNLSTDKLTSGTLPVGRGGTGGTTTSAAKSSLGILRGSVAQAAVNANTSTTAATVNFGKTFSSAPTVIIGMTSTGGADGLGGCSATVTSVTTTGFTYQKENNTSSSRTFGISWVAIGD